MIKQSSAPIVRLGTIPMKGIKRLDVDRLHHSYPSRLSKSGSGSTGTLKCPYFSELKGFDSKVFVYNTGCCAESAFV
ncbi:hypothetical protein EAF00_000597 [Botryotinia globosa]|nr:hypothetical protein EAF00_000597 [Botryotinia globosa]